MTVHHVRVLAIAAVLVGISALVPSTRLQAQQPPPDSAPVADLTLDETRARAEQGDAGYQYALGFFYNYGVFVPEDAAEAARWYQLASDQGRAYAQFELGRMYAIGRGVQDDDAEAVRLFRLAADQGLDRAQYMLGLIYDSGEGVPQDDAEAIRWYRLAADQGNANAQFKLGFMYDNGEGVPQGYVEAHMWYNLAAAQSSGADRESLVKGRDALAARMTTEQVAEAQRRAREWTPTPEP